MHQAGSFNPAFGAEGFGLKDLKSICEALVAKGGALSAETGVHRAASVGTKPLEGK